MLNGYARNLSDGSVEVMACGDIENVTLLTEWLHNGPELASVTTLAAEPVRYQTYKGFEIQ